MHKTFIWLSRRAEHVDHARIGSEPRHEVIKVLALLRSDPRVIDVFRTAT